MGNADISRCTSSLRLWVVSGLLDTLARVRLAHGWSGWCRRIAGYRSNAIDVKKNSSEIFAITAPQRPASGQIASNMVLLNGLRKTR